MSELRPDFTTEFEMVFLLTIITSVMSIIINSIYINNVYNKREVKYKDIITGTDETFIAITITMCMIGFSTIIIYMFFGKPKKEGKRCPKTYTENITDASGKSTTLLLNTTIQNVRDPEFQKRFNCDTLRFCFDKNDKKMNFEKVNFGQYSCEPKYHSTRILILPIFLNCLFGIITIVLLYNDKKTYGELTHSTNSSSDAVQKLCMAFATISGAMPLCIWFYLYGIDSVEKSIKQDVEQPLSEGVETISKKLSEPNVQLPATEETITRRMSAPDVQLSTTKTVQLKSTPETIIERQILKPKNLVDEPLVAMRLFENKNINEDQFKKIIASNPEGFMHIAGKMYPQLIRNLYDNGSIKLDVFNRFIRSSPKNYMDIVTNKSNENFRNELVKNGLITWEDIQEYMKAE